MQARRAELVDVLDGDGLVADLDGRPVGVITWQVDETGGAAVRTPEIGTAEIRVLAVGADVRERGIGRALLAGAEDALTAAGMRRAWLVTTNDNLAALALYQKAGWRLAELRAGAIDDLRRTIKPSIPETGEHGIPIRDELELDKRLGPRGSSQTRGGARKAPVGPSGRV